MNGLYRCLPYITIYVEKVQGIFAVCDKNIELETIRMGEMSKFLWRF